MFAKCVCNLKILSCGVHLAPFFAHLEHRRQKKSMATIPPKSVLDEVREWTEGKFSDLGYWRRLPKYTSSDMRQGGALDVESCLGAGGMGEVVTARHRDNGEVVAIKLGQKVRAYCVVLEENNHLAHRQVAAAKRTTEHSHHLFGAVLLADICTRLSSAH